MGVAAVVVAWEYLSTVYRIDVTEGRLELYWPLRRRFVEREELESVELSLGDQRRQSKVALRLAGERRLVRLSRLGVSVAELYRALTAWKQPDH
jgi:hypothetical protein